MIHIHYKLKPSDIHGIGLFSDQEIKKGNLIYTESPLLDVNLTQREFDSLSQAEQKEIKYYGFFDITKKKWHVDFDVSKFINHSDDAMLTQVSDQYEACLVARKDIALGEELTQNYLEFVTPEEFATLGIN